MFSKLFRSIYLTVFVNIVVSRDKTNVYIEVLSQNKIIEHIQKSFKTLSINKKMIDFILSYTSDTPYFYVSFLDKSSSQGAIGSCSKKLMSKYYNLENSKYMCTKDKWTYYTSAYDLQTSASRYKTIGLDFVFSPFLILSLFFKDKIDSTLAMYILIEDGYLSLSIFDHNKLLFASQLSMEAKRLVETHFLITPEDKDKEKDFDLEEDNDDNIHSLDDLTNIEDLSSSQEFIEFDDEKIIPSIKTKEELSDDVKGDVKGDVKDDFNEDYLRYILIQDAMNIYYKDDKYESTFIEDAYIADNIGLSSDLKKYLEEEMFLNVVIRKINLSTEICELAKAELL